MANLKIIVALTVRIVMIVAGHFLGYITHFIDSRDLSKGKADLPFSNKIDRSANQPLHIWVM